MPRMQVVAGGLAAVSVVVVLLAGAGWLMSVGKHQLVKAPIPPPGPSAIPLPLEVSSTCPLLQPGGPISVSVGDACTSLHVQRPYLDVDCRRLQHLPDLAKFVSLDATSGNFAEGASLTFTDNGCRLTAPANREGQVATQQAPPVDQVLIVDFVTPAEGDFELGLAARCTSTGCVNVETDAFYLWMSDRTSDAWDTRLRHRMDGSVQLVPSATNRLVMWLGDGTETAWLNGQRIGTTPVKPTQPGEASFFVLATDGSTPVALYLQRFVVLLLRS